MSPATLAWPPIVPAFAPQPYRWTCDEFHQLGDEGRFEGRRAILIEGVIWELGPMNPPHAIGVSLAQTRLLQIFSTGWVVRIQLPLQLSQSTDPLPGVCVVPGNPRDYVTHPTSADLVVEVSDTTLNFDLGEKANLYAAAGILDYWVIDLVNRRLMVHRNPQAHSTQPHGHWYQHQIILGPTDSIAPLAAPTWPITVAELLP